MTRRIVDEKFPSLLRKVTLYYTESNNAHAHNAHGKSSFVRMTRTVSGPSSLAVSRYIKYAMPKPMPITIAPCAASGRLRRRRSVFNKPTPRDGNLTSQSSSHSRRRVHETAIVRAKRIDASPRRVRRPSRPPERLAGRAFERMSRVNTIGIKSENAPPRRARRRRDDDLHAPESSLGPAPYMVDIAPVRERW